jgi:hypothetical protein
MFAAPWRVCLHNCPTPSSVVPTQAPKAHEAMSVKFQLPDLVDTAAVKQSLSSMHPEPIMTPRISKTAQGEGEALSGAWWSWSGVAVQGMKPSGTRRPGISCKRPSSIAWRSCPMRMRGVSLKPRIFRVLHGLHSLE